MTALRLSRLLPGIWLGGLLTVALVATPAPFALLAKADAGRVVGRILAQEAATSLVVGVVLLALARLAVKERVDTGHGTPFTAAMALAAGSLFCTVAGYYAIQPLMEQARAGHGALGFGALHAISAGFYALKVVLVAALAWRASSAAAPHGPMPQPSS